MEDVRRNQAVPATWEAEKRPLMPRGAAARTKSLVRQSTKGGGERPESGRDDGHRCPHTARAETPGQGFAVPALLCGKCVYGAALQVYCNSTC